MNKRLFPFFMPLFVIASTLHEQMPAFNKAIEQFNTPLLMLMNTELSTRIRAMDRFVQTAHDVEQERALIPIPKGGLASCVEHSKELVSLIDSSYQAQLTLYVLLNERPQTTLDCIFHALLKATEIAYQETACYPHLSPDIKTNAERFNGLFKKLESAKPGEIMIDKFLTRGRESRNIRPSFQILMQYCKGLFSTITTPCVITPGQPEANWPIKQEGCYQYVVIKGIAQTNDDRLQATEALVDIENQCAVVQPGIFFEIISVDRNGSLVDTPVHEASHFKVSVMGFYLNGIPHSLDTVLISYPTRKELEQEDFQFRFSPFKRKTNTLGGENFLPEQYHSFIQNVLKKTISARKQDVFVSLELPPEDHTLYILDQVKQAIKFKQIKDRPLEEEEQETIIFCEELAVECGAKNLEELKEEVENLCYSQIHETDAQQAVTNKKPNTPTRPFKKGQKQRQRVNVKQTAEDDELLAQLESQNEQLLRSKAIEEDLKKYLGSGKRTKYRHTIKMINAARRHGALSEDTSQTKNGSHRKKGGYSMVVPHGNQKESSLMANNGRMLNDLVEKLSSSIQKKRTSNGK